MASFAIPMLCACATKGGQREAHDPDHEVVGRYIGQEREISALASWQRELVEPVSKGCRGEEGIPAGKGTITKISEIDGKSDRVVDGKARLRRRNLR